MNSSEKKELEEIEDAENKNDGDRLNLTQQVSNKIVEMISKDPSSPDEGPMSTADIRDVISDVISENIKYDEPPTVDESEFKIKDQNYSHLSDTEKDTVRKNDAMEYLTAVTYIAIDNAPMNIKSGSDMGMFMQKLNSEIMFFSSNLSDVSFFDDLAQSADKTLNQLQGIQVPVQFVDIHKEALSLAKYGVGLSETSNIDSSDPLGMIAEYSKVQNLFGMMMSLSAKSSFEFGKLGIDLMNLDIEL